jgi:NADH-quinone oxidoreductase subunit A
MPQLAAASPEAPAYLVVTVFFAAAVAFALLALGLARLWAWRFAVPKPGPIKNATYECGLVSTGDAWIQFKAEYYLYAIIFLVFDVEAIFLVPFAVAFTSLPVGASVAILIFLLLLVEGLVWAWRKGLLNRQRS